jgi:hypothetical protein
MTPPQQEIGRIFEKMQEATKEKFLWALRALTPDDIREVIKGGI